MNLTNHTTKSRKNKYLTEKERYKIEALLKVGISKIKIAQEIGKSERTIRREVVRGTIELRNSDYTMRKEYCADYAQRKYLENASNKGPNLKIGNDHRLAEYIEYKIVNEKYSPDAVIGRIKLEGLSFKTNICTKTLYSYIQMGLFLKLSNKHLLVKKNEHKRKYRKVNRIASKNRRGRSIEERPEEIDNRETLGHWEMDSVQSARGLRATLLVLTERLSRKTLIFKMKSKTQEQVGLILDKLERKHKNNFNKIFKSITMDNGGEFLDQASIEKSQYSDKTRTVVFYAHPFSAWERGSNENTNKIIRRFIPKASNIANYSKKEIERIQHWINNYPRRILEYKTALEVYQAA